MKKFASLLVAMLLVVQAFGMVTVFAAEGTAEDPILISTAADFAAMNGKNSGKYFKITQDLDFSGYDNWSYFAFSGHLDGDGHKIQNLNVNATAQIAGLFSEINGTTAVVENLIIDNTCTITSTANNLGAFAGKLLNSATLRNCVNYANVTGAQRIGGFVGQTEKYPSTIEGCVNYGTITGTNKVGGIIGDVSNKGSITISKCANYGTIDCASNAAGIGGNLDSTAVVTDCYNEGSALYGIAGNGKATTVSNCLVNADVTNVTAGSATNIYYCGTVSNANGATQVTEEQLTDGTVTALLNAGRTGADAPWAQVNGVPGVNAPAEDDGEEEVVVTAAEITGITDTTVAYNVTLADADKSAVVIIALYKGDQLFAVKTVSADETSATFTTTVGTTNAKIFVWESLRTARPIAVDEY